MDNIAVLRQRYGLNKSANEVAIVIEAYRTLRDWGPYPAEQIRLSEISLESLPRSL